MKVPNSMNATTKFTQRRRAILASLLTVPGALMSALTLSVRRASGEAKRKPPPGTFTVTIHPHAVPRTTQRESTHR